MRRCDRLFQFVLNTTTFTPKARWRTLLLGVLFATAAMPGQDGDTLIGVLIRKGILTNQEAEAIRADLVRENNVIPVRVDAGKKSTERLSIGMRIQIQYANLDTDIRGAAFSPAATDHAFLRRMYLTVKAGAGGNWGAVFTYDFAGGGYDEAIIEWEPMPDLAFNFGLRKVNVAYEERASSGSIKAIERSSITRYFVESNNGRRLGAASYRIGAFLDGRKQLTTKYGLVYGAAVTNPERNETFSGSAGAGDNTNNNLAYWGNVGVTGKLANNASWIAGVGAGFLPDQGGMGTTNLGRGFDLTVYSVHADITAGRFGLMAEYLTADVDRGASATSDAAPRGFFIQPSLLLTETIEAVVRYAWLDSDHRGVTLSDVVRSAPSGGTMTTFIEWYAGANWYLRGDDLKFQLGAVYGKTRDTLSGAPAQAEAVGVRSQMQMQF
jgi:phosphate-selective porin